MVSLISFALISDGLDALEQQTSSTLHFLQRPKIPNANLTWFGGAKLDPLALALALATTGKS